MGAGVAGSFSRCGPTCDPSRSKPRGAAPGVPVTFGVRLLRLQLLCELREKNLLFILLLLLLLSVTALEKGHYLKMDSPNARVLYPKRGAGGDAKRKVICKAFQKS